MQQYCSSHISKLFQKKPLSHKASMFKARSWTETVEGYINNANELSSCILRNLKARGVGNCLAVSINVRADLDVKRIKTLWWDATRKMRRRGVQALWVREPNARHRCNYHLLVLTPIDPQVMREILSESMPKGRVIPWHTQVRPVRSRFAYSRYICKARMAGTNRQGRPVADLYAPKRLLFVTGTGLDKHGTIGKFWVRPKAKLWQEIKDIEAQIADGLTKPGVRRVVDLLVDWIGDDPHFTARDIERRIGYSADAPGILAWAAKLEAEHADKVEKGHAD